MARLRLENLHRRYGDTAAVRGVTLDIADGELLALLGPSGCGKTTTLHLLAGFARPDEGEIWSDERLISSPRGVVPPERRNIGMVFQSYALWPHLTVAQNVAFGLEMRRDGRQAIRERVAWVLGVVNLAGFGDRYPHELSGGQQQRVALARALAVSPGTLLLDEPLSNLDANLREQMRFEIRRVHQETGTTMVYVTHDQAEAMVIADRVAVMNGGLVEQVGPPRDVYEQPRSRFVASFIGNANCLPGEVVGPGLVRCGDVLLRCAESTPTPPSGRAVTLCIRPTAVRLAEGKGDGERGSANLVAGRVRQQAYLGDHQDVRIDLAGGLLVRALVPSRQPLAAGQEVVADLPPEDCRLVLD